MCVETTIYTRLRPNEVSRHVMRIIILIIITYETDKRMLLYAYVTVDPDILTVKCISIGTSIKKGVVSMFLRFSMTV